jgi:hypothetical protein
VGTFKTFEEIEAWQQARTLARLICDASGKGAFGRDFGLRDQVGEGHFPYFRLMSRRNAAAARSPGCQVPVAS